MKRLENYVEELVKFTLLSHINQTLDFDLGLSIEFCSGLLKPEPDDAVSLSAGNRLDGQSILEGVPLYPLYKRLASALCCSVNQRAFCRTYKAVGLINEDVFSKQREEEWNGLVLDKGSELVNVNFELHVDEPFFSLIKDGVKTVEGRCAVGDYNRIGSGAMILLNKCMLLEVQCVRHYASFLEMLEAENLEKVLPGVQTIEEGVRIYRKFYVEEKERSNGVLALCVSSIPSQPYISLGSILSGLSYGGIQSLLGLAHTAGTISNALPPPRSSLLSSFMFPFKPNVKSSTLTHGARALAKHANRSNYKYWGILNGSVRNGVLFGVYILVWDFILRMLMYVLEKLKGYEVVLNHPLSNIVYSDKNRLAMDVIGRLIAHCCWLNVHIVPPHGIVFEIRVAGGYGARWSKDGTKAEAIMFKDEMHLIWKSV
ncbi:hypothetical protein JRO89_XS03G0023100 [Xanthoceras sorbifolium]|uniref:ASCH domain-containing protein n=1 Tax=Xanthoceras sorbifolium TaxID=99658 RepID=A0ABQ8I884_9ROSI|nr:hypothetical protein JRO89_XS03G0023100 [Xanthoceras sorbifolium]